MIVVLLIYFQVVSFFSCERSSVSGNPSFPFDSIPDSKSLNPLINEISGIADSKVNPGFLWGQEDSGNPSQLYLISHNGSVTKTIFLKGIVNRDWEDMALAGGDIYIAETGDNNLAFSEYSFYKFPEPGFATDTVRAIDNIRFTYEDGSHDAEAFLVDAHTKDIYIITKRDSPSKIYKLAYPYSLTSLNAATFIGALPYSGVVSAAFSPSGNEIIIKTYTGLRYYIRTEGESVEQVLRKSYVELPYKLEPQGEAISFANDNSGFFTLSEKGFGSSVNLYFYKRK
jgi:hypothetical protein